VYSYQIDMDLFVGSGVGDWRSAPLRCELPDQKKNKEKEVGVTRMAFSRAFKNTIIRKHDPCCSAPSLY